MHLDCEGERVGIQASWAHRHCISLLWLNADLIFRPVIVYKLVGLLLQKYLARRALTGRLLNILLLELEDLMIFFLIYFSCGFC